MRTIRRAILPLLLSSVVLLAARAASAQPAALPVPTATTSALARPTISILSPATNAEIQSLAIIRFKVENARMASPFQPADTDRVLPAAHIHVSVDGATWHWIHASTDPVVITPLAPGAHTVTLELAGADHRPLHTQTVRFIVLEKTPAAADHASHR